MTRYVNIINGIEIPMTAEEISTRQAEETAWNNGALDRALEYLRIHRNKFLSETDYLALSDLTMSSEMTTYRQALRDLTNGLDTVEKANIKLEVNEDGTWKNFPTKPSGE